METLEDSSMVVNKRKPDFDGCEESVKMTPKMEMMDRKKLLLLMVGNIIFNLLLWLLRFD